MASIDDQLEHLTNLHLLELKALRHSQNITNIVNRLYSPCTKQLVLKINQKLSTTYTVESATFITNNYANILDDINKFTIRGTESSFYDIFMHFIKSATLHVYSNYARDFLELLIKAF